MQYSSNLGNENSSVAHIKWLCRLYVTWQFSNPGLNQSSQDFTDVYFKFSFSSCCKLKQEIT